MVEGALSNQKLLGYSLSQRGHRFKVAANGRQAVEDVVRDRFDVLVMDVQMRVMDGVEARRAIRMCFGREAMFHAMVDSFFDEADPLSAGLQGALDRRDAAAVQSFAHRLKNAVMYLGAPDANKATDRVSRLAHAGELAELPAAVVLVNPPL